MNKYHIVGRDISEVWFKLLQYAVKEGKLKKTRMGATAGEDVKELGFVIVTIEYPWTLPLIPVVPEGFPPPVREEDMAALAASTMYHYELKKGIKYYGCYLESQLDYAVKMYKEFGWDINQMCFLTADSDNLFIDDPWVLKLIDTKIENGSLDLIAYIRGLDLWQGFVMFSGALQMLKEHLARKIGCKDGQLHIVGKSFNLPEHQWSLAEKLAGKSDSRIYHFE